MSRSVLATVLVATASAAAAEMREEHLVIGPEQVWIEVIDPLEIMWVGPNDYERTQVLSGADIEIVAQATDAEAEAMLSVPAIVAEVPGTHSCADGDAREYYVVTLGRPLATDGPLTTCTALAVSVTPGAILLQGDPIGGNESWAWSPGKGFAAAN